jgi:gamma-glutamyltranspeptidase/glutathione hydrolase
MTPTLLVRGDDVVALGTGGANRIRTSMMVVLDHLLSGRPLQESILAPRLHIEAGGSAAEALIQDDPRIAAIEGTAGPVDRFDHLHLYFGGVHCAASLGGRLQAFGDSRRSGVGGVA